MVGSQAEQVGGGSSLVSGVWWFDAESAEMAEPQSFLLGSPSGASRRRRGPIRGDTRGSRPRDQSSPPERPAAPPGRSLASSKSGGDR